MACHDDLLIYSKIINVYASFGWFGFDYGAEQLPCYVSF